MPDPSPTTPPPPSPPAEDAAPRILLADADAFFVAVARLVDPDGAGRAPLLLVGGSAEQRGVVCSASYEARRFGVHAGMPMARAIRHCPGALVVPVARAACVRYSRAIRAVLGRFAPVLEAASIDEWYLDLSATPHDEPLLATARRMRAEVHAETGLSVSIGGGTNKLIAKLAVELAKRPPPGSERGAYVVAEGDEAAFMTRFQLGDIPGIGRTLSQRLAEVGLHSVSDALGYDLAALQGFVGERAGRFVYERARGVCAARVAPRERTMSRGRETTFAVDLDDDRALVRELGTLATRTAAELRASGETARTVTVRIKDADFTARQKSVTVATPVDGDDAICALANQLLAALRDARAIPARLLGISLSNLSLPTLAGGGTQLPLFADAPVLPAPDPARAVQVKQLDLHSPLPPEPPRDASRRSVPGR